MSGEGRRAAMLPLAALSVIGVGSLAVATAALAGRGWTVWLLAVPSAALAVGWGWVVDAQAVAPTSRIEPTADNGPVGSPVAQASPGGAAVAAAAQSESPEDEPTAPDIGPLLDAARRLDLGSWVDHRDRPDRPQCGRCGRFASLRLDRDRSLIVCVACAATRPVSNEQPDTTVCLFTTPLETLEF